MFIGQTLPFVKSFVDELDLAVRAIDPAAGLSRIQKEWLGFCVLAIFVTNSVCWKRFERACLGEHSARSLSWMFCQANRWWAFLFRASIRLILKKYGITEGVIVFDDSEKKRATQTTQIYHAHKMKDKKTGGFINGQQCVLMVLVTPKITLPVGIEFYMPDPALTAWNKEDKRLKQSGMPRKDRPAKPKKNATYPTMPEIAVQLAKDFRAAFPDLRIRCVLADNLYAAGEVLDKISAYFGDVQAVSTLRKNQKLRFQGKKLSVSRFFQRYPGVKQTIRIRGGKEVTVWVSSARVHVCAHGTKRFVIALKYEGEEEYRYLVATDMSWRTLDIVQAHTLRWLVEVFFQDWKAYEGWGQLAKQPGEDGSRRSVILSLLCDHCLLLHPDQLARIEDKLPACTVGSLRERVQVESALQFFKDILSREHPHEYFDKIARRAKEVFTLNTSSKHMNGRDLGRLESTPAAEYRAKAVMKTA
jgi:hypothetical protein